MADAALLSLILAPALITYLLKSNAALAYLALCASFVLVTLGSADLRQLTGQLNIQVDNNTLNLILLFAPMLLTLLIARKAFSKGRKKIMQLIAAVCTGGLLALIAVPLLNASSGLGFADSAGWELLQKGQTPVIVAGLMLSLLLVWTKPSRHDKKHK